MNQTQQYSNNFKFCNKFIENYQINGNLDIMYLLCNHPIYLNCFKNYAKENMLNMRYKKCYTSIYIKKLLEEKFTKEIIGDLIKCPSCHELNSFGKG